MQMVRSVLTLWIIFYRKYVIIAISPVLVMGKLLLLI